MNGFGRKKELRINCSNAANASGYWLPHICATETRNQQNHILAIATPLVFCA